MSKDKNSGWISIHRKIEEWPLYFTEPFTKAHAWIDLILLANHKKGVFSVRGNLVHVDRGQVGWSKDALAKRWNWSRNKVLRFLKWLETEQQIEQQKSPILSLITIVKYEDYQENGTTDETTERQQKDNRRHTNNNDNNKNNDNKDELVTFSEKIESTFLDFKENRKKTNNKMTFLAEKIARNQIKKYLDILTEQEVIERIEQAIVGNWKGLFLKELAQNKQKESPKKKKYDIEYSSFKNNP